MKKTVLLAFLLPLLLSCASSSGSVSSSGVPDTATVYNFYCVNDFHGAIVEHGDEIGIAKYFGELKSRKAQDPEHTIILSAGDMFQGSIESNANYGRLIVEAMNEVGFDAMTLGNHEFDYGQSRLRDIISWADFPILAGNIMKYDHGATNDPWNSELIKPSTVVQKGGHKIGVVGMIGEGQTKSITSSYVQDMAFVASEELAKKEARRLREQEGCSIVILDIHDQARNCSYAADKTYFDGVFTAHTHRLEKNFENDVPFLQTYCNGAGISFFQITLKSGSAKCTKYQNIMSNFSWEEDEKIAEIRDKYILEPSFADRANAVAGIVDGTLYSDSGIPRLGEEAIYHKYRPLHPDICGAMMNSQRDSLSGTITYRDIVQATPFMNHVVIAKVLGRDINNELEYNYIYPSNTYFNADEYYTIACVDFILFHQNENKVYDYFSSLNDNFAEKIIADYEDYPFDIMFDYIHDDLEGHVDASLYNR